MVESVDLSKWFFATENYNDDFHTDIFFLRVATSMFSRSKHNEALMTYEKNHSKLYLVKEESRRVAGELIERFLFEPNWRKEIAQSILNAATRMEMFWDRVDISENKSIDELITIYKKQCILKKRLYQCAWPLEEMHSNMNSIETHLSDLLRDPITYSDLLYTPQLSAFTEEMRQLQIIINDARKSKCDYVQRVRPVHQRFKYLVYHGYTNPTLKPLSYYTDIVVKCLEENSNVYDKSIKEEEYIRYKKACRKITEEMKSLFSDYANLGVVKSYRRLAELKNFYYLDKILLILSKRFSIPLDTIRFMTPEEVVNIKELSSETLNDIAQRGGTMTYYYKNGEEEITTSVEVVRIIEKHFVPVGNSTKYINGTIACPGLVKGRAKIITENKTVLYDGEIIVTNEPNPELYDLITRAAAIVIDQGGVTCHFASLARERGIPCIIGTQIGTKVIHEGSMIIVDAEKGIVEVCDE